MTLIGFRIGPNTELIASHICLEILPRIVLTDRAALPARLINALKRSAEAFQLLGRGITGMIVTLLDSLTRSRWELRTLTSNGWHCQFLEPDLKTPLPRKLTFKSADKLRALIERGRGITTQESRSMVEYAINVGRGGVFLRLSEEQYSRLKSRACRHPSAERPRKLVDCLVDKGIAQQTLLSPTLPVGYGVPIHTSPEFHRNVTSHMLSRWITRDSCNPTRTIRDRPAGSLFIG
jgi:hypothetical protein